jgi:hypothetical protein
MPHRSGHPFKVDGDICQALVLSQVACAARNHVLKIVSDSVQRLKNQIKARTAGSMNRNRRRLDNTSEASTGSPFKLFPNGQLAHHRNKPKSLRKPDLMQSKQAQRRFS